MEALWDSALVLRLEQNGLGLLYGVATDDSYDCYQRGPGKTNPGRGGLVVHAESLESDDIVRAMKAGDFYASSGVTLASIQNTSDTLVVAIAPKEDVVYIKHFIGTLRGHGEDEIGAVLGATTHNRWSIPLPEASSMCALKLRGPSSTRIPTPKATGKRHGGNRYSLARTRFGPPYVLPK